ncbi:flagellar assembly peptidoglycan hydrolase FlgJ [Methylovorus sp. SPW-M1]
MVNAPSDSTGKLAFDANSLNQLKLAGKNDSPEAIKAVAKQFEAVFVNMMLKSMRDATPQEGMFDNEQSRTFTAMLDQQLSQNIASKGIGLADVLARQLSKTGVTPGANPDQDDGVSAALPYSSPFVPRTALQMYADPSQDASKGAGSTKSDGNADSFQATMAPYAEEASRTTGIPANFMLGQAALESGWGKREIKGVNGENSYNLFGIKATAGWTGKTVDTVTTEYVNGVKQKRVETFRAYDSYADSFKDFANMISKNPRYGNAMSNLNDVNAYAQGLQNGGYATDPDYASKLISVIKKVTTA